MNIIKKMKRLGLKLGFQKMVGYEAIFSCAFCEREPGRDCTTAISGKKKIFRFYHIQKSIGMQIRFCGKKTGKKSFF